MAGVGVTPYWELTFDADGDPDRRRRERLVEEVRGRGVKDLLVFAHGWNNDRSVATKLYDRFFAPFPQLAPRAGLGYTGVVWPAMRFSDEPIPDFDPAVLPAGAAAAAGPALDKATRQALNEVFPGSGPVIEQIARLLEERPASPPAFDEFGRLVRQLVEPPADAIGAAAAADTQEESPQDGPAMLFDDTAAVCQGFMEALAQTGAVEESTEEQEIGFGLGRLWNGARELLRQGTYYAMKRRAGTVGQLGLGPALGQLAREAPGVRVHLIGHSFGGRLVSFALRGLPDGVRNVKSVTLLQGAFSHYAFAERLPHQRRSAGALRGQQGRVDGPVVCCYSKHDTALGVLYPMASRMAGDSAGLLGFDRKWGALGHDGIQAVPDTKGFTLREALAADLPDSGCVNIDAAQVVRRGGPPAGAHSDICHEELARVVLAAGRIKG
ncbi:serine-threonine protein kinase [Streptomyces monticola]|uniref:Serine-threonine protein kinase n=1 Tax=Streptomyces monticola TaxID=2666263 RepID=A0ABW2JN97_9ACTN